MAAQDPYVYHVTTHGRLPGIATAGLMPNFPRAIGGGGYDAHAKDRVFLTSGPGAFFWHSKAQEHAQNVDGNPADDGRVPIVLRAPRKAAGRLYQDALGTRDSGSHPAFYNRTGVAPEALEVYNGRGWVPVAQHASVPAAAAVETDEHGSSLRHDSPLFPPEMHPSYRPPAPKPAAPWHTTAPAGTRVTTKHWGSGALTRPSWEAAPGNHIVDVKLDNGQAMSMNAAHIEPETVTKSESLEKAGPPAWRPQEVTTETAWPGVNLGQSQLTPGVLPVRDLAHQHLERTGTPCAGHEKTACQAHVKKLTQAIQRGESLPPIVVREEPRWRQMGAKRYVVDDGNHRVAAALKAGFRHVPVVIRSGPLGKAEGLEKADLPEEARSHYAAATSEGRGPAWMSFYRFKAHMDPAGAAGFATAAAGVGNPISQPGHVYRGINQDEHDFIARTGGIKSNGTANVARNEGTVYAKNWEDAHSYAVGGERAPEVTGKPGYVLEVEHLPHIKEDPRDGYLKTPARVPEEHIKRAWRIPARGKHEAGTWGAQGFVLHAPDPIAKSESLSKANPDQERWNALTPAEKRPFYHLGPEMPNRPGHVYRGINQNEHDYIVQHGKIQSDQRYCVPGEGTCFHDDWNGAEGYTNLGHTHPEFTGRPTYVLEVAHGPDMRVDRDGYHKVSQVPASRITRAWRFKTRANPEEGSWHPTAGFTPKAPAPGPATVAPTPVTKAEPTLSSADIAGAVAVLGRLLEHLAPKPAPEPDTDAQLAEPAGPPEVHVSLVFAYDASGRLLLGYRDDEGSWTLAGGHVEEGEDPAAAAARELFEEAGLVAFSLTPLVVRPNPPGRPVLHVYSALVAGTPHGRLDPDRECQDWFFVDVKDGVPPSIWDALAGPPGENNVVRQVLRCAPRDQLEKSEHSLLLKDDHDAEVRPAPPKQKTKVPKKAAPKEPEKNLVVVHNLSAENLHHAAALGGLAAPSIAIKHKDHTFSSFGDISLVGHPNLVDPSTTPVYDADVYSPRHPRANYNVVEPEMKKFRKWLYPYMKKVGNDRTNDEFDDKVKKEGHGSLAQVSGRQDHDRAMQLAYLEEKGHHVPIATREKPLRYGWVREPAMQEFFARRGRDRNLEFRGDYHKEMTEAAKAAIGQYAKRHGDGDPVLEEELRDTFLGEDRPQGMIGDGFLHFSKTGSIFNDAQNAGQTEVDKYATGDKIDEKIKDLGAGDDYERWAHEKTKPLQGAPYIPRHLNSGGVRKIPYTMDNVLSELTRTIRGGESFNYGLGTARSMGARKFRTHDQIKNTASKLMPHEEFEKHKEKQSDKFGKLADKVGNATGNKGFGLLDGLSTAIGDSYRKGKYLGQTLRDNGFNNVPIKLQQEIADFSKDLLDSPTEYFEAKPQRAVGINEFPAAVVPHDARPETLEELKRQGVGHIETYERSNEESRRAAVERAARAKNLLLSEGEWGESLEKAELQKMAIANVPNADVPGSDHRGAARVDWSHVLSPEHQAAGYGMKVFYHPSEGGGSAKLVLHHGGKEVGTVSGAVDNGLANVQWAHLEEPHRNKGLGSAMYEAFMAHVHHNMGAHTISSTQHSPDAARVHASLARKHRLAYKAAPGVEGATYSYALKSEGLEKSLAEHGNPHERGLATFAPMSKRALLRACLDPHPDTRAAALGHRDVTPEFLRTLCAARRLTNGEHPGAAVVDFLTHRHATPEHAEIALKAAKADPSHGGRQAERVAEEAKMILSLTRPGEDK